MAWLAEVQSVYGMDVATEVASPAHVEAALKAGIDYLWIGARSSANPMTVENLSTALSSKEGRKLKGIIIKNPVNEDAGLWLGNIERLEKAGVPVMAVHRGCGHQPCWAMAHKVRLARPDIPMLLDPSHMSGDAEKVPELMQKIGALGMDGMMVEVHCCPEQALSDSNQQLTPTRLGNTLDSILSRLCPASLICPPKDETELNWLRAEIDELDEKLWDTIGARMEVSKRIGEWKKANGVAPLQPERYQEILKKLKIKNEQLKMDGLLLSEEFMMNVWELIHQESLRQQK